MKKTFRLLVICLCFTVPAIAQQSDISGVVRDDKGFVQTATVSILNAKDSSWVRSAISDEKGAFTFTNMPVGNYLASITAIGYITLIQPVSGDQLNCYLQKENASLREVTVTGKKPFVEVSLGKTIVNVDASPASIGMNVIDLLRKMPGVTVDQNGNISMQGKQGVLVLIDDQPTYLSPEQLVDYLKTIPSDELSQIELITQPSAGYDAAGNAGIINLKRKKSRKEGVNGTGTLTAGQGVYPFVLGSALINYHKNKLNLSLSGDEHKATGFAYWSQQQRLYDPQTGSNTSITNLYSTPLEHFSIANLRIAANYDISDKASTGISMKGGYHTNSDVDRVYSNTYDALNNTTTFNTIISPQGFIRKDLAADAYYSYKFNNDHILNIDIDYLSYYNSPYQNITNTAYDAQMQPQPAPLLLHSYQPSLINVYSIKGDYTDTLKNGIKLEAGFKSSLVTTDNNAEFSINQNNTWIPDTTRTNRFLYKENINALYISAGRSLGSKWEARAGLRAENTNANGIQKTTNEQFNKSYTSLFPTAYISYKENKDNQFELNYGRRTDRPSYQSLNPFIYYSFQYSYSVGNPYLQPQYTNSIELKHSYKNMLITSASFTNTTGVINDILVADNATGVVYSTKKNIGTNNAVNLSATFNKELYKWWSINAYATYFYAHYKGVVDNYPLVTTGPGFFSGMNNQFNFVKGWKAECGIYYSGKYLQSIMGNALPSTYTSLGIAKKLSETSTLKMDVQDPLYVYRFRMQNSLPGLQTNATFRYSTRSVSLAYTYSFGKSQSKQKDVDAIDESKRIK